ncbi:MAG: DUF2062 domain-containing protein, partial [Flavobacteriales bacterium CG_4_10_14_0_2_um_filter_32_8]
MPTEIQHINSEKPILNFNFCIIIPTYNNAKTLKRVIDGVLKFGVGFHIIVVNDGSTDETAFLLEEYKENLTIITNPVNRGKG